MRRWTAFLTLTSVLAGGALQAQLSAPALEDVLNALTLRSISGDLPRSPINVVVQDRTNRDVLIVGNDIGVYVSIDTEPKARYGFGSQGMNYRLFGDKYAGVPNEPEGLTLNYLLKTAANTGSYYVVTLDVAGKKATKPAVIRERIH